VLRYGFVVLICIAVPGGGLSATPLDGTGIFPQCRMIKLKYKHQCLFMHPRSQNFLLKYGKYYKNVRVRALMNIFAS